MNKEFKEILTGIHRVVQLLSSREKRNLYIATFIMLLAGLLTNLPAIILGKLVDKLAIVEAIQFDVVVPFLSLVIIIILVREVLTIIRKYLVENIATQLDKEQTVRVIERLLKTDTQNFLYKQQIGSLHGRIFRSMQGLIRMLKLIFLDFAPIFFSAAAAILIALYQKPFIATVMVLVMPAGLLLIIKQVSSQKGIRVALIASKEKIDGKVVEMLGGIETIRVVNSVQYEVDKIEDIAEKARKIEMRHHISMAFFDSAKYLNEGFFYILVIVLSILFASKGIISRGDILVYSILFLSITGPLREVHRILDQAHESSIQINDLYALLHQPLDVSYVESTGKHKNASEEHLDLEISKLSFSYDNEKDSLLHNINLKIKQGENIGIVGASGCGKTTLIHILLKLVHNYSGKIYLFGDDLTTVTREELAKKVAYVPQKPFIFSGTISENIIYGIKRSITEDELINATKNANIYDEIQTGLGGWSGIVTENGTNLSGGQRQRLAIARVMLMLPELLIFDEATSALDNRNEAIVQKNIQQQFRGKTMLTIAHRLTTLKNTDRICVFDRGNIVQEGDYGKLEKEKGLFQDFLRQRTQP